MPVAAAARPRPRTVAWLGLVAVVFLTLRGAVALGPEPQQVVPEQETAAAAPVVVVGVTGRTALTATDRQVLTGRLDAAQVGVVAIRARYLGRCVANGWATLGAGRRADVGGRCAPEVVGDRIQDWAGYREAVAANRGDARLGTLAGALPGCVSAVGPGAALAAARADGTLAAYAPLEEFVAGGAQPTCPLTLIDAGARAEPLITQLAGRADLTVIVTGIGPAPGSDDPAVQVIYRLGAGPAGYLTSDSTRRRGVVTLTDLTRTLIEAGRTDPGRAGPRPAPAVDGSPLEVDPAMPTLPGLDDHLRAVTALSDAVVPVYWGLFVGGSVLFFVLVSAVVTARYQLAEVILTFGTVTMASLMLPGALPWAYARWPSIALGLAFVGWSAVLTMAAIGLGRWARVPAAIAAAGLSVAAFTVDAALGAAMQPGSVINSRPIFALRWYGFGNVTFAAYATSGLILAGYLAGRRLHAGRRSAALAIVAALGVGMVLCEGWPSMGSDFGGVLALTPAVLWLLLALSGRRITALWLLLVVGAGVAVVAAVSVLDWARGPDARSHLGDFVQRILDGDAGAVVARKAVASAATVTSLAGVIAVGLGVLAWVAVFRYAVPGLATAFPSLRPVAGAVLITAVLGTVANDGGINVWITATAVLVTTVAWFGVHAAREAAEVNGFPSRRPARAGRALRTGR